MSSGYFSPTIYLIVVFSLTVSWTRTPGGRTPRARAPTPWRRGWMSTERTLIPPRARKSCWPSSPKWPSPRCPRGSPTPDVDWRRRTKWRGRRGTDAERTGRTMMRTATWDAEGLMRTACRGRGTGTEMTTRTSCSTWIRTWWMWIVTSLIFHSLQQVSVWLYIYYYFHFMFFITFQVNTRRSPNVGLMLGQDRRRSPNIEPTLGQGQYIFKSYIYINAGTNPPSRYIGMIVTNSHIVRGGGGGGITTHLILFL